MKTEELIYDLRIQKKSYNEISRILNISKASVSYHCKKFGLNEPITCPPKIKNIDINELNEYYKNHTADETARKFNVSRTTVICNVDNKRIKLTKEEIRKKNYIHVQSRRQVLKKMGVEYLGGKCIRCNYNKCMGALQFHHRDPKEKDFTIGRYRVLSWEKIRKELDKCDLLCSNCHDEVHYENWDVSPLSDKQLKE